MADQPAPAPRTDLESWPDVGDLDYATWTARTAGPPRSAAEREWGAAPPPRGSVELEWHGARSCAPGLETRHLTWLVRRLLALSGAGGH